MSSELVPVNLIDPELRILFAQSDIDSISTAAAVDKELYDYSKTVMSDAIQAASQTVQSDTRLESMIGLRERFKLGVRTAGKKMDIIAEMIDAPQDTGMLDPATVLTRHLRKAGRHIHPDHKTTATPTTPGATDTFTELARATSPQDFHQRYAREAVNIAAAMKGDQTVNPHDLELLRYNAVISQGLKRSSKFKTKDEADKAAQAEHDKIVADIPHVTIGIGSDIALYLLGHDATGLSNTSVSPIRRSAFALAFNGYLDCRKQTTYELLAAALNNQRGRNLLDAYVAAITEVSDTYEPSFSDTPPLNPAMSAAVARLAEVYAKITNAVRDEEAGRNYEKNIKKWSRYKESWND